MKKLFVLSFILSYFYIFSQSASFDNSFGTNGKVLINRCPDSYFLNTIDLQSDGKIVHGLGGYSDIYGIFSRTNSNGTLDTTFGTNGYYELSTSTTSVLQTNSNYTMFELEVQNDNKIVSAGWRESFTSTFCISRMNPNGGLDTTFNGTGFLEVSFGAGVSRGNCMKLQNDGKILVGGRTGSSSQYFSILCLNSDGTLDNSFGTLGKVQTLMIGQSLPYSIALQTDGKILMGGYVLNGSNGYDFALVRYLSNGTLDTTFGTNGIVVTTISTLFSDSIRKVLVQSDGKIVVVGNYADSTGESRVAMVRYMNNGTLDTSFATNGIYISDYYGGSFDAKMQVDGKIIVSGYSFQVDKYVFSVFRYLSNGTLDSDFVNSNVSFPFNGETYNAYCVLIQPDNKIVVGGENYIDENCQVVLGALVRINPGTLLSNKEFEENELLFYPNPTENVVSFDNSISQFQKATIINYLGQEVGEVALQNLVSESVNLSDFSNGVYLVKLENSSSQKSIKIIKK
jgi:uncharacterized delta-60 repeat protein